MAVLAAEPDLEPCPPAATVGEVISTPGVDVVLLHGGLDRGHGPIDVVRAMRVARGPAWVVLTDDVPADEEDHARQAVQLCPAAALKLVE